MEDDVAEDGNDIVYYVDILSCLVTVVWLGLFGKSIYLEHPCNC